MPKPGMTPQMRKKWILNRLLEEPRLHAVASFKEMPMSCALGLEAPGSHRKVH